MGLLKRSKILFHCYVAHLPVLQLRHPRARTTASQTHTRTRAKRLLRATRSRASILTNNVPCEVYATFSISSVVHTQLHNRQLDLNWNCRFRGQIWLASWSTWELWTTNKLKRAFAACLLGPSFCLDCIGLQTVIWFCCFWLEFSACDHGGHAS